VKQAVTDAARVTTPSSTALVIVYALVALYGTLAGWVGVATLDVVGGPTWALLWPILTVFFAVAAIAGVLISRRYGQTSFELVTTLLLIALLVGYALAIVVRTEFDGNMSRLPVAVLPVALSVHPFARLVRIARGVVMR